MVQWRPSKPSKKVCKNLFFYRIDENCTQSTASFHSLVSEPNLAPAQPRLHVTLPRRCPHWGVRHGCATKPELHRSLAQCMVLICSCPECVSKIQANRKRSGSNPGQAAASGVQASSRIRRRDVRMAAFTFFFHLF